MSLLRAKLKVYSILPPHAETPEFKVYSILPPYVEGVPREEINLIDLLAAVEKVGTEVDTEYR